MVPPEIQRLQTADAARSQFASRYLAYRQPLTVLYPTTRANRCDTYYLSPWMVMAVVDVGSVERFESPLSGQDIVEFHYPHFGRHRDSGAHGASAGWSNPSWLVWFQPSGCDDASERLRRRGFRAGRHG